MCYGECESGEYGQQNGLFFQLILRTQAKMSPDVDRNVSLIDLF